MNKKFVYLFAIGLVTLAIVVGGYMFMNRSQSGNAQLDTQFNEGITQNAPEGVDGYVQAPAPTPLDPQYKEPGVD